MNPTHRKVTTLSALLPLVADVKAQGKRVVTTNGCFDIIHPGHTDYLEWARNQGDVLIVGINSDASVRKLKGPLRPIVSEGDRAKVLAALAAVDYVFVFGEDTPREWMEQLRPDVHVKGAESEKSPLFAAEKQRIEEYGGELRLAPQIPERSSTSIIDRIRRAYTDAS